MPPPVGRPSWGGLWRAPGAGAILMTDPAGRLYGLPTRVSFVARFGCVEQCEVGEIASDVRTMYVFFVSDARFCCKLC
jgi:hypothetical protein